MSASGVFVTATAMVSSLGLDAATSCASARAGLSRAAELLDVSFLSEHDGQVENAVGHAVPIVTQGFVGDARLVCLLARCLTTLRSSGSHRTDELASAKLYLSLPPPKREFARGANVNAEKAAGSSSENQVPSPQNVRLLSRACHAAQWSGQLELRSVSTAEHVGGIAVLERAVQDLQQGSATIAIVCGVDSLIDANVVGRLYETGRLKCSANPVGISPGEAGALVVLERKVSAGAGRRSGLARVVALDSDYEGRPFVNGGMPSGEAMCRLFLRLSDKQNADPNGSLWVICDQNGEVHRAVEWGNALVRWRAQVGHDVDPVVWFVPEWFGEIGAVSGIAGMVLAARAFTRGYAPRKLAAIVAAADDAPRRLVALEQAS